MPGCKTAKYTPVRPEAAKSRTNDCCLDFRPLYVDLVGFPRRNGDEAHRGISRLIANISCHDRAV
jgi:hypothetical protein